MNRVNLHSSFSSEIALQDQFERPLRRLQDSRTASGVLSGSLADNHDRGGYNAIDNFSIVAAASSEVRRVRTGAEE